MLSVAFVLGAVMALTGREYFTINATASAGQAQQNRSEAKPSERPIPGDDIVIDRSQIFEGTVKPSRSRVYQHDVFAHGVNLTKFDDGTVDVLCGQRMLTFRNVEELARLHGKPR